VGTGTETTVIELESSTNVTIKYIELLASGYNNDNNYEIFQGGTGFYLGFSYLHNSGTVFMQNIPSNSTVDHTYFWGTEVNGATNNAHGQAEYVIPSSNNGVRSNNVYRDIAGTAIWTFGEGGTKNNWLFYNNTVVYSSPQASWLPSTSDAAFDCINSSVCTNITYVQNTIINCPQPSTTSLGVSACGIGFADGNTGSSATIENNLYYGNYSGTIGLSTNSTTVTSDYNSFLNSGSGFGSGTHDVHVTSGAPNPFVNWPSSNFNLASDNADWNNRLALSSPYTVDVNGVTFTTDRGAYQFTGATASTPVFTPPTGTQFANGQIVTITSSTSGATLCYTTDSSTPTATTPGTCSHGTTLANGGTVNVSATETVKVLATLSGDTNSSVASASFTVGGTITSNIDDIPPTSSGSPAIGWATPPYIDTGCGDPTGPSSYPHTIGNTSPSLDGFSSLFTLISAPEGCVGWFYNAGPQDLATVLTNDFEYYSGSTNSSGNANEFDLYEYVKATSNPSCLANNTEFYFGTQCVTSSGNLQIWDQGGKAWHNTSPTISCASGFATGAWHHITMNDHWTCGDTSGTGGYPKQCYDTITIDGVQHTINNCYSSGALPGSYGENSGVNFELDVGSAGTTLTANLDEASLTFSQNPTITVTTPTGGSVADNQGQINCPSACVGTYASGTVVVLTATPSSGYAFTGWSGAGCSGTGTCSITATGASSVSATFSASSGSISVSVSGTGIVTSSPIGINCPGTCSVGFTGSVTLNAAPSGSYVFSGWYGGGCSGTLPCTVNVTSALSINAVFSQTGTPSVLTNNLTATSTACSIASNIVTITASNTFTANSWIGLSGFTTCTQLNGQILLTNSSTNSTKVVGTLYNVQKVAQTLSNLSTTSDTTGYLQGQGWQPFVTAPFPLCNGAPGCAVTSTVGTFAYDFSIPCSGSDSAPCSPFVAMADYTTATNSLSPSASGESYDHGISLPDGLGNYMYVLVTSGRQDIFSGHIDSSFCNNVPCFIPDVTSDSKAWYHTPMNYGAFSRSLAKRPGSNEALWYSLYSSTPYASPFWLKSDVLAYTTGALCPGGTGNCVISSLTTNLYDISTCPGFGYTTLGTGLAFSGAMITDNYDDKVEFILGSGSQGGPGRHMQFIVSLANGTCETLDTDGMTGTAVYTYGVTASHGGTGYTNGDTITGAYGDTYTATVSGGVVTALTQVTAGTGASLGQGHATTGGTGTGLEYDVTGIGTIGTYATLYAPISSASCPAGTTLTCEVPITTGIYTFGIHAGGMLSSGTFTWLSGWGTSGQPGQCSGCDYVIWTVGNSPALTGTTSGNQNGHPSGGFNWLGTASNPNYYLNQFLAAISDPSCSNLSDCQLLYTLPSGGTGGNCSTSPGGAQMHSAVSTILNDDSLPILITSSINTAGTPTQTNPPNFTCALGQNSLFSVAKTGGTTWYAHHYENGNNHAGEQFEGTDTICTESPDAQFAICDEDMYYGFPGNTGLATSLAAAAEPFSLMLNMGIPVIAVPAPPLGMFANIKASILKENPNALSDLFRPSY
jgi:hypothetical protein